MSKAKSLFEKEMKKKHFQEHFEDDRREFQLELQLLRELETQGLTYEKFAQKIGSSRGNISRDLKSKGLKRATIDRIVKMAAALGLEFLPLLLPKDPERRRAVLKALLATS